MTLRRDGRQRTRDRQLIQNPVRAEHALPRFDVIEGEAGAVSTEGHITQWHTFTLS
ncbi:MAG: hypothetical protein M3Y36_03490 [Actinomycetota bacterium]|nr:hypothetical protein [Actinomycetota bacterium]